MKSILEGEDLERFNDYMKKEKEGLGLIKEKILSTQDILKELEQNRFVIVCVDPNVFYKVNQKQKGGHFIVIFGYYKDEKDEYQFVLMDPNFSEIQTISEKNLEECRTKRTAKDVVVVEQLLYILNK